MSILSPFSICHLSFFFMVFFVLYSRMGRGFRFSFKSKRPNLFEFRIGKVTPLLNPSQVFFSKILGHLSPSLCVCVLDLIYLLTIINFFFFFFRTGTRFFFLVSVCLSLSPEAWYLFIGKMPSSQRLEFQKQNWTCKMNDDTLLSRAFCTVYLRDSIQFFFSFLPSLFLLDHFQRRLIFFFYEACRNGTRKKCISIPSIEIIK